MNNLKYVTYIVFLFVFIYCLSLPINVFPDSDGYLSMSIIRSASYPIFLNIIKIIFGSFFKTATILIQVVFGIYAVHFFIKKLKNAIQLHQIWYLLLTVILLSPYVYNHFLANRFLSEALSYPLYLIIVAQLISIISTKKTTQFVYVFPLLFILLLTRNQFLYLIPVGVLVILHISYKNKVFKNNIWILLLLISFPLITSITDKTYHKLKHGHFVNTPWSGIHLISPAFYVADKEDVAIFKTPLKETYFKEVLEQLSEKQLNINYLDSNSKADNSHVYISSYSKIANQTVFPIAKKIVDSTLSSNEKYIAIDELTKDMTLPLILNNSSEWLKLYLKNVIHGFGNSRMFLLFGILLIFGLVTIRKLESIKVNVLLLLVLVYSSNILLVAIGINTIKRYLFYNDWVIFLILFMLLDAFISFTKKNESIN